MIENSDGIDLNNSDREGEHHPTERDGGDSYVPPLSVDQDQESLPNEETTESFTIKNITKTMTIGPGDTEYKAMAKRLLAIYENHKVHRNDGIIITVKVTLNLGDGADEEVIRQRRQFLLGFNDHDHSFVVKVLDP